MPLVSGLGLPESPRWRDGWLYVSDVWGQKVIRVADDGRLDVLAELPDRPSGLGFLPDGRLLIVLMRDRRILVWDDGDLGDYADLSAIAGDMLNELIVHPDGHVYVGDFRFPKDGVQQQSGLILVGHGRVANGMFAPNGMAITPDGRTLIVAESAANRLTAFSIAADGTVSDRRSWALLDFPPDGICLTDDGDVWVASPHAPAGCRRIAHGGALIETLPSDDGQAAFACVLGGEDRRTLYRCEAPYPTKAHDRQGRVTAMKVSTPGAGLP